MLLHRADNFVVVESKVSESKFEFESSSFELEPESTEIWARVLKFRRTVIIYHYSSISSGVALGSITHSLFLLFISDLNRLQCPLHSKANDSALSFFSVMCQTTLSINGSRGDVIGPRTTYYLYYNFWTGPGKTLWYSLQPKLLIYHRFQYQRR